MWCVESSQIQKTYTALSKASTSVKAENTEMAGDLWAPAGKAARPVYSHPLTSHSISIRDRFRPKVARRAAAAAAAPNQADIDKHFMGLALQQARVAFQAGEVPIGAVLVFDSQVLAAACNLTETRRNPLSHAELLCISAAAEQQLAWRLHEATLYSTIEPCPMCAGAILQARLARLVYGAKQPRVGADGSWVAMFPKQPQQQQQQHAQPHPGPQPCSCQSQCSEQEQRQQALQPVSVHPFHPNIRVTSGVLADDCAALMREFFRKRRREQQAVAAAAVAAQEQLLVGFRPGAVATRSAELDAAVWLGSSSCDSQEEEPSVQPCVADGNKTS